MILPLFNKKTTLPPPSVVVVDPRLIKEKPIASYPTTLINSRTDPYFTWIRRNVNLWTDADRNQVMYMLSAWKLGDSKLSSYTNNKLLILLN